MLLKILLVYAKITITLVFNRNAIFPPKIGKNYENCYNNIGPWSFWQGYNSKSFIELVPSRFLFPWIWGIHHHENQSFIPRGLVSLPTSELLRKSVSKLVNCFYLQTWFTYDRVARFFSVQNSKMLKIYQIITKLTKWKYHLTNNF
jgi:hypothetical protein